jgi:outer membrane protein assembly factor BamB
VKRVFAIVLFGALAAVVSSAQVGKITQQDWVTSRADAQRTSWIRSDAFISPDSMQKPGFGLRWKVTLGATSPISLLAEGVVFGNLGFGSKPVSFITSRTNRVFAVDNDSGVVFWERELKGEFVRGNGCPGGITSAGTRPATLVPVVPSWRGLPERGPYSSAISGPGEGVLPYLLERQASARAQSSTPPPPSAPPAPPLPQVVYVLSSDGQLHTLGLYSGKDVAWPLPFLPPNARSSDLIAIDNVVYTTTRDGCGGVADGVWAMDLDGDTHAVKTWKSDAGSVVGRVAFGTNGTLFIGSSNAIVALDPKALTVRNRFVLTGSTFVTSPVVFTISGREVVAATAQDGSVLVLDAASLSEVGRSTVGSRDPRGLATWEDRAGTRWLLATTLTNVSGIKATFVNGALKLEAGWTSQPIGEPLQPIIVSGVAFTISSNRLSVLYALDAATGRELWTSGRTITSPALRPALWAGIGQVHVATSDNTVYAFGFAMERD